MHFVGNLVRLPRLVSVSVILARAALLVQQKGLQMLKTLKNHASDQSKVFVSVCLFDQSFLTPGIIKEFLFVFFSPSSDMKAYQYSRL